MVKASDWEAEGTRFNSRRAQDGRTARARRPEIWILPHPEMQVLGSFGDGEWDNCPKVKKIWGEIEKCLYYHPMAEQFMWVLGSGSWVFVEIEGLRKMSGGGSKNVDFQKCLEVFLPGRGSPD